MVKPLLISFEGLDGVGKSTQMLLFAMKLEQDGIKVSLTKEPGGTALGQRIRDLLLTRGEEFCPETELFLFLADRSHHVNSLLLPKLKEGYTLLVDRYIDSTIAYQHFFPVEQLEALNEMATRSLLPDLTFYYDLTPTLLQQRLAMRGGEKDRMEGLIDPFLEKVRSRFLALKRMYPERIVLIDANRTIEEVAEETYVCYRKFAEKFT